MAWINFGGGDIDAEIRAIKSEQQLQRQLLLNLLNSTGVIMALVSIEQSVLDEVGVQLGVIADGVQAIIDDPSNDLGPADLTSVTNGVSRLQAIVSTPETPVEPEAPAEPEVPADQ